MRTSIETYWLKGSGTLTWACFTVEPDAFGESKVSVLAIVSATQYIDQVLTPEDARGVWNQLVSEGWHRANDDEVTDMMMSRYKLLALLSD